MKFKIQHFGWCLAIAALTTAVMAADSPTTSAEKARQAITTLQSNAPGDEKAMACKRLAVYGQADAVPALAPLLADEKLASWARIALEVIPGSAADEALRAAMPKLHGKLLVGVINSIGVRRDAKAVGDLTSKLKDADAEVASAAAVALGRIGGDKAAKALEKSLASGPVATRSAVAQGCILCAEQFLAEGKSAKAVKLYDTVRKADVPKQRHLEATRGAILARKADGIPLLLETLRSPDKAAHGLGLRTARELRGTAVTDALSRELVKTQPDRQGPLFLALADRDDVSVMPVVLATAKSGPKNLRLLAIEVMVREGKPACVPVLFDTLAENDVDVELAKAAKAALAGWWGKEVDGQLTTRLPRATGNSRRLLVELAGQRHAVAAMPELIKAASDVDPAMRTAGIKALGETAGTADLGALTDLLAKAKSADDISAVQEALESTCQRVSDKAACADKLIASLATSATPAKCALLRVLGVVTTATALDAIRTALASPEASVRDTAVRVLADWPETPALPALLEVLRTTQDDSHRFLALRGCVRLLDLGGQPPEKTLETYRDMLSRTERTDDRKALLSGLANVADPAALKLVGPLLKEAQVQAEAEVAMLKIAGALVKSAPADAKAAATQLQTESQNPTTRDRAAKILADIEKSR